MSIEKDMLEKYYALSFKTIRDAISNCSEERWAKGPNRTLVPARLVFHMMEATDFRLSKVPKAFDWNRFGVDWERSPAADLLTIEQTLSYIKEVEEKVNNYLTSFTIESLHGDDIEPGFFSCPMDRILMDLRHLAHHTGQLNSVLRLLGATPGKWV